MNPQIAYKTIASDNPWPFKDSLPGNTRGAAKRYKTMTIDKLKTFLVDNEVKTAPDCILYLWRVSAMVEEAYEVARAWGFTPKSEIIWIKTLRGQQGDEDADTVQRIHEIETENAKLMEVLLTAKVPREHAIEMLIAKYEAELGDKLHFGMGHYTRNSHESCIIATKGKTKELVRDHSIRSVFFAPVREHSEKPRKFYELVERMANTPRLELFARRRRMGWDSHGHEVDVRRPPPVEVEESEVIADVG